jgi:hypothetical protein
MAVATWIASTYAFTALACVATVVAWQLQRSVFSLALVPALLLQLLCAALLLVLPFAIGRLTGGLVRWQRRLVWVCAAFLVLYLSWANYQHGKVDAQLERKVAQP